MSIFIVFFSFSPPPPPASPFSPCPLARRNRACGEGERGRTGALPVAGPGCAARLGTTRHGSARLLCLLDGAPQRPVAPPPCPLSRNPHRGGGGQRGPGSWTIGAGAIPWGISSPRGRQARSGGEAGDAEAAGRYLPAGSPRCRGAGPPPLRLACSRAPLPASF